MLIKICGTTNLQDAQQALAAGADALGFIFAPSKRRITAEVAAAITAELPAKALRVGVFTSPDAEEIIRTARQASLSAVQMHFPLEKDVVSRLTSAFAGQVQLWQVIPVAADARDSIAAERDLLSRLQEALADARLGAVLLDTAKGGVSGGLGATFPWHAVRRLLDQLAQARAAGAPQRPHFRLLLAGGLHPGNVGEAIETLRPDGVDVVSGVEAMPGRKDPVKVSAFIRQVRETTGKRLHPSGSTPD